MLAAALSIAIGLAAGQPSIESYAGVWTAEFSGNTYVRLELTAVNGTLAGSIGLGDIEVNSVGEVRAAKQIEAPPSPIFDVAVDAATSTLSFARKDGADTDRFEFKLADEGADLHFILSEGFRQELAQNGIPVPKPVRLKKIKP
jgi:hypothetical protein